MSYIQLRYILILTNSLTRPLTYLLPYSLTHSLTHSLIHLQVKLFSWIPEFVVTFLTKTALIGRDVLFFTNSINWVWTDELKKFEKKHVPLSEWSRRSHGACCCCCCWLFLRPGRRCWTRASTKSCSRRFYHCIPNLSYSNDLLQATSQLVLFYSPSCPKCHAFLATYAQIVDHFETAGHSGVYALIHSLTHSLTHSF